MKEKEVNQLKDISIKTINAIERKEKHIKYLVKEIQYKKIDQALENQEIQEKIKQLKEKFEKQICSSIPNAFWKRKKHIVNLPHEHGFVESNIPTKAKPIQMNQELPEFCKKERRSFRQKIDKKKQVPLELFNFLCSETG